MKFKSETLIQANTLRVKLLALAICSVFYFINVKAADPPSIVRLAVVVDVGESGLLDELLPDFENQTGYRVAVYSGTIEIYDRAREGEADLVISHYGHSEVEQFILDGFGLWPRTVFANQSALLGPSSDPAHIHGLTDAVEAFRRIAQAKSPFVVNHLPVIKYIEELLWEGAGRPKKGDWYIDSGLSGQRAVEAAAKTGAYTLWGLGPFLRFQEQSGLDIQALVFDDSAMQRIMVSIVVNPEKVPNVNSEGARALQQYLIAPATQARIRAFRYLGFDHTVWPAGLHNDVANRK